MAVWARYLTGPRLKTDLWVQAQIRVCDIASIPAVVARRGDSDSGQVVIRNNRLDGTYEVFARTISLDGTAAWRRVNGPVPVDGEAADLIIVREANVDPDVWVVEIEDPDGKYELDGPVV